MSGRSIKSKKGFLRFMVRTFGPALALNSSSGWQDGLAGTRRVWLGRDTRHGLDRTDVHGTAAPDGPCTCLSFALILQHKPKKADTEEDEDEASELSSDDEPVGARGNSIFAKGRSTDGDGDGVGVSVIAKAGQPQHLEIVEFFCMASGGLLLPQQLQLPQAWIWCGRGRSPGTRDNG